MLAVPLHTELKIDDPALVHEGEMLDIFFINRMISVGGFGQVFDATFGNTMQSVAVKVESLAAKIQLLSTEAICLRNLNGSCNPEGIHSKEPFLRDYGYGVVDNVRYLAMEKCGANLRDVKKATQFDKFSTTTSLWLMYKMVDALRTMHTLGWLHRDVKPANFCVGLDDHHKLFLIDFGMARYFLTTEGKIKPRKVQCCFHGTLRYVSLNIHKKQDASTWDDLWSVFYMTVENIVGQLPWRCIVDRQNVADCKKTCNFAQLDYGNEPHRPHCLSIMHHYLQISMLHAEEYFYCPPPYQLLLNEVNMDLSRRGLTMESVVPDWQAAGSPEHPRSAYLGDYLTPLKQNALVPIQVHRQTAVERNGTPMAGQGDRSVYFY